MSDRPIIATNGVSAVPLPRDAAVLDFIALLKPRVMSLVVFTAFVGLLVAPVTVHPFIAFCAVIFIALGGGGLLGGVGAYLKACRPDIEVVACSPANSCVMHDSIAAGHILDQPSLPTLSDGTAGGVEADSITFELCRDVVDHRVLVDESQIVEAMRILLFQEHTMVEGAAGVALAGYLAMQERFRGRRAVVLLCGANASEAVLREVMS